MTSVPSSGADPEFRHLEATLYWELRRLLFNLALLPAAFLGYLRSFPILGIGNLPPQPGLGETLLEIAVWIAGANVAYSLVYPLERFVCTRLNPGWRAFGREFVFFLLTTVAVALTIRTTRRLCGWDG